MTDMTTPTTARASRLLPVAVILAGAVAGWVFLGDYLTFDTLRENREALLAFRDAHYLAVVAAYMAIYVLSSVSRCPARPLPP